MDISLTPELGRMIREKLASGAYGSEVEVLQAAFQALESQEQTLAAIAEGYGDFQAGRYRPIEEADAEFRRQHNLPPET
jgi:putative addiction module CopG family antidote